MTVDERKMTIAYADFLSMRELSQHVLRMDADELMDPDTRKTFVSICINLDKVICFANEYMSKHTNFNSSSEIQNRDQI